MVQPNPHGGSENGLPVAVARKEVLWCVVRSLLLGSYGILYTIFDIFLSPRQTNQSAIARWVGRGPECDKECTVANTLRVHSRGMTGRGFPRDTSHRRVISSKGTSCKTSPVIAIRYALISIDDNWSLASWWKSMKSIVAACIHDKASATTLCLPRMYWMSEVNSAINERCRAWRGDRSAVLARA